MMTVVAMAVMTAMLSWTSTLFATPSEEDPEEVEPHISVDE
jgi:hypothetical protein